MTKTEPDSSQRCIVNQQEAAATNHNKGNSSGTEGRNYSPRNQQRSTATGIHRSCRVFTSGISKANWARPEQLDLALKSTLL